jgi:uncharacterized protein
MRFSFYTLILLAIGCGHTQPAMRGAGHDSADNAASRQMPVARAVPATAVLPPHADHHKHLISPAAGEWSSDIPLPAVELPPGLDRLLMERAERWAEANALSALYSEDAILLEDREFLTRGRNAIASFLTESFARPHRITPIAYEASSSMATVVGYFSRDVDNGVRHFGHVLLTLRMGSGGTWAIVAEAQVFPGPHVQQPLTAESLIAELDAAGVERALVLSVAYWYGSGRVTESPAEEYAKVRAENDWNGQQAARFPGRLIAFCSFNPLRGYALAELDRCARHPDLRGLKFHFGNSRVDVTNPAHVEQLRAVFRAANQQGLPVVLHLWTDPGYDRDGRDHAQIVLDQLLPEAPDIPVQVAHFAGGGPGYTDAALGVYADAISAGDSRVRNLYFDLATVAERQSDDVLQALARRIRQIGLERVLWASDMAPPNPAARSAWLTFRSTVPLTDDEFAAIARNVAPYLH